MSAVEETVPAISDADIGKARRRAATRLDQEGLANQLASLALGTAALRDHWRDLYGSEAPPALWRSLLIRALAYRLQEQVYGALKPATRRWLEQVADDVSAGRPIRPEPANGVKPGTRLLREWQGVTHEVVVTENGVLYRGERYRSLSQVARLITGSRWSGPLFFGLKATARHAER